MTTKLPKAERDRLVEDIQYLNLEEMRDFCKAKDLPLHIRVEKADGKLRKTTDRDRKDIVLRRILDFALNGKRTGPTIYETRVVAEDPLSMAIDGRTRIHYGQYEKKNTLFLHTMERLTDGAFKTGMIARLVLRDFWTQGKAPTMKQFAVAWLQATEEHKRPRPEGAYLSDMWRGEVGPDWKQVRIRRAKRALATLDKLTRV